MHYCFPIAKGHICHLRVMGSYKYFDPGIKVFKQELSYSLTLEDKGDFRGEEENIGEKYSRERFNVVVSWYAEGHKGVKPMEAQIQVFDPGLMLVDVVATLGKVDEDNLGRLFSEYLGLAKMLAIVCKTYESIQSLETYDFEGPVNKVSGVYALGASVGRTLQGRFTVTCLENLRPYAGEIVADDPQRSPDILKPRLPSVIMVMTMRGDIKKSTTMVNLDPCADDHELLKIEQLDCILEGAYGNCQIFVFDPGGSSTIYASDEVIVPQSGRCCPTIFCFNYDLFVILEDKDCLKGRVMIHSEIVARGTVVILPLFLIDQGI